MGEKSWTQHERLARLARQREHMRIARELSETRGRHEWPKRFIARSADLKCSKEEMRGQNVSLEGNTVLTSAHKLLTECPATKDIQHGGE